MRQPVSVASARRNTQVNYPTSHSAPLEFPATTGAPAVERRLEVAAAVCRELYVLAAGEDEQAAAEAARTPYWAPHPTSVVGHRAAAAALRSDAARLESALRRIQLARLSETRGAGLPRQLPARIS
jgi:hypothetical protein